MNCDNCKKSKNVNSYFTGVVEKKCKISNCFVTKGHYHNLCNKCRKPKGKPFW